jgi:hypothetical protein
MFSPLPFPKEVWFQGEIGLIDLRHPSQPTQYHSELIVGRREK